MDVDIVVSRVKVFVGGVQFPEFCQAGFAGDRGAPPAGRIDGLREEQRLQVFETGRTHGIAHLADQFHVIQRRFALLHDHAVLGQAVEAVAVECLAEQAFGRAGRIGAVDDDNVHRIRLGFFHPFDAVDEFQIGARIVIGFAQFGEVDFGQPRDALVDVDLYGLFDGLVLQDFPQGAAVAAADDPDAFRIGVRE